MAKPHLPGHRRTRPGGQAGVGPASAPRAPLGAAAAEAAEAEAAAWVEESWSLPPGEEPGWFRDDALTETGDAGLTATRGAADEGPAAVEQIPGET